MQRHLEAVKGGCKIKLKNVREGLKKKVQKREPVVHFPLPSAVIECFS